MDVDAGVGDPGTEIGESSEKRPISLFNLANWGVSS